MEQINLEDLPGRSHLYVAEEVFGWPAHQHLLAADSPLGQRPVLPFVVPNIVTEQGFVTPLPFQKLTAQPLVRPPYHTTAGAHTRTADAVQQLQPGDKLLYLKKGRKLLGRLRAYAFAPGQLQTRLHPDFLDVGTPAPPSSWTHTNSHAIVPTGLQQTRALQELEPVFLAQFMRHPTTANGETAVSKQVAIQFTEIINVWLRTRYAVSPITLYANTNTIASYHSPPTTNGNEHAQIMQRLRYPLIGPSCPADSFYKEQHPDYPDFHLAGHPDFAEHVNAVAHPMLGEIKVWTAISGQTLSRIHGIDTTNPNTGHFLWGGGIRGTRTVLQLIKQLWGELVFFQARLGFLTNGEEFIFFVKPNDNELVVSETLPWGSPNVYLCMLGLSMMAADSELGGYDLQNLIESVCPNDVQHRQSPF